MSFEDEVICRQTELEPRRLEVTGGGPTMMAVVTTGIGDVDRLVYREVPIPRPAVGEVMLQVLAAGVNATDVNTRLGWYADGQTAGAVNVEQGAGEHGRAGVTGWQGPTPFPLIQGTDCCGRAVAVGPGVDESALGRRVLVRPCMRPAGFGVMQTVWMGSDFDGSFAQYVSVPASEAFVVESDWSDAELGAVPCVFGTAENMLRRAGVVPGEHVVITGASGGVGLAAVQLAKRREAFVTAVTAREKAGRVLAMGADVCLDRGEDLVTRLSEESADVVVDNVCGPALFGALLRLLRRGGRYVSSGAAAGPLVSLDHRVVYLKDLTLIGCTAWDEPVFADVIAALERREIRPIVAKKFPLARIAAAQRELQARRHVGKLVLIPPSPPPSSSRSTFARSV